METTLAFHTDAGKEQYLLMKLTQVTPLRLTLTNVDANADANANASTTTVDVDVDVVVVVDNDDISSDRVHSSVLASDVVVEPTETTHKTASEDQAILLARVKEMFVELNPNKGWIALN